MQEEVRARRSVFVQGEVQRVFPPSSESPVTGGRKNKGDKFGGFFFFYPYSGLKFSIQDLTGQNGGFGKN